MSISELTGKIFTNAGKEVIIFSLLVGNEGGGAYQIRFSLSLSLLTDVTAVAEVTSQFVTTGSNSDCEDASFILGRLFIGFNMKVAQSCPTLCNSTTVGCQVRLSVGFSRQILEWAAMLFSRGLSQPRDQTKVSHITGGFFTIWATREALIPFKVLLYLFPQKHFTMWVGIVTLETRMQRLSD